MMVYPVIEKNKVTKRKVILGIYDSEERAKAELDSYLEMCEKNNYYIDDLEFSVDCYILNMPI